MPLDNFTVEGGEVENGEQILGIDGHSSEMQEVENEQQVIMDGQEYYEHDYEVNYKTVNYVNYYFHLHT